MEHMNSKNVKLTAVELETYSGVKILIWQPPKSLSSPEKDRIINNKKENQICIKLFRNSSASDETSPMINWRIFASKIKLKVYTSQKKY